ncbi:MAG: ATP-binding protein [Pseudomonadota bacterium]
MNSLNQIEALTRQLNLTSAPALNASLPTDSNFTDDFAARLKELKSALTRSQELYREILRFRDHVAEQTNMTPMDAALSRAIEPLSSVITSPVEVSVHNDCGDYVDTAFGAIQIMVGHLVRNAIEALNKCGGGKIKIHAQPRSDSVVIDIEDNGDGIPAYVLDRLFPTWPTPPKRVGKIGIGLPITAAIARDVGGELLLLRTSPKGAAMRLCVPASIQEN